MGDQCSKIIAALAQIVNAPQTDAQLEAEVIPRDFVMEKVVDIRDLVYAMRSTLAARDPMFTFVEEVARGVWLDDPEMCQLVAQNLL